MSPEKIKQIKNVSALLSIMLLVLAALELIPFATAAAIILLVAAAVNFIYARNFYNAGERDKGFPRLFLAGLFLAIDILCYFLGD